MLPAFWKLGFSNRYMLNDEFTLKSRRVSTENESLGKVSLMRFKHDSKGSEDNYDV